MEVFAYIMMGAFVLIWLVLLVKFLRVVAAGKRDGNASREEDEQD